MDNTVLLYRLKTLTAFRDLLAEPVLSVAVSLLDALSSGDAATALTNCSATRFLRNVDKINEKK